MVVAVVDGYSALAKSVGEIEAEAKAEPETNTETKVVDVLSSQEGTHGGDAVAIDVVSTKTEIECEDPDNKVAGKDKTETKKNLQEATMRGDWTGADSILKNMTSAQPRTDMQYALRVLAIVKLRELTMKGDWSAAESILKEDNDLVREAISSDGSTVLHIAVGIGHNDFVKNLFSYISDEDVVVTRNSDGSTALHIAAIVGNKYAADLLLKKNKNCLRIRDKNGQEPLHKAYENMHLDTIGYLLKAVDENGKSMSRSSSIGASVHSHLHPGVEIGVDLLVNAISAKQYNLASELIEMFPKFASKNDDVLMAIAKTFPIGDYGETFIPPTWKDYWEVESNTHIHKKKEEMDEAEKVLELVCDEIDKLEFTGTHHPYYTRPILEAACQNAHKVVDEILYRSPEAILSKDKSGYDIIQLSVIHRSERIYNLIYHIGERKNLYRTVEDSSKNNILHLAGRLAPSSKLKKRIGAALQLQRELQWREEVKEVVFPTYITQENIFKETPGMVFTREHEKLVKDGESWMKTTAESSSITAALITTIVFAAAITVPGGSNQDKGMPVFTKEVAFIIFAVSDTISLFAASTALLVFLSILTARFSEKDFLVSLPRRLLIGICTLLLSAISMIVAFSATVFLVFCHQKPWMLAPICGLSLIPISFLVALQLPLIVDLSRSTYLRNFGPRRRGVESSKDRKNQAKMTKLSIDMEKNVQNSRQSPKMPKSESIRISSQTGAGTEEYYWMNNGRLGLLVRLPTLTTSSSQDHVKAEDFYKSKEDQAEQHTPFFIELPAKVNKARVTMSSATSDVTYTSVYTDSEPGRAFWGADDEEVSEGGIPRVIVLGYDGLPLQPVPQDEDEREPMFIHAHDPDYVPEPIYPEYIPLEDDHEFPAEEQPLPPIDSPTAESPGYVTESDPEEDPEGYEDDKTEDGPVDYPMDGGDDGDDDDGDSSRDDD
ncbi:ankyrin repeat-containing domain-containing LTR copia-type protein [Tanacetum coccineum]